MTRLRPTYRGVPGPGRPLRHLLVMVLSVLACFGAWGQRVSNWRTYKAADGLRESVTTSVTVSPRGNVWVRHGEVDAISMLDGYTVRQLPAPGEGNYRVYESRAGKVWSVYGQGILECVSGQWVRYPIQAVRLELEANVLRQLHQTPLLPAEEDRVLILLADRLMEYRSLRSQEAVLRWSRESALGDFQDLSGASDGGVWVTGVRDLAKLPGPLRRLNASTPWTEHAAPPDQQVTSLRRPIEDPEGGVTMVGDSAKSGKRVLVHFDGAAWRVRDLTNYNFIVAWRAAERDVFWGLTRGALVRILPDREEVFREMPAPGRYHDAAPQARGAFWIATSEGLLRYAPSPWRNPLPTAGVGDAVHALFEDETGSLLCATSSALLTFAGGAWQSRAWPENFEASFRPREGVTSLPDGRVAVSTAEQVLLLEPRSGAFNRLEHPEGRHIRRVLACWTDQGIVLQTREAPGRAGTDQLELFDGEKFRPLLENPLPADMGSEYFFVGREKSGDLWLCANTGPALYHDRKWQRFGPRDGYSDDGAICWVELDGGRIWCAGLSKILEFDGKNWSVVRAGFDRVRDMLLASDGSVWVATSSGLYRYYKESWAWVGEEDGLPSGTVYSVIEDRNRRLWVGTSRGLAQYEPRADIDPPKTLSLRTERVEMSSAETNIRLFFNGADKWHQTLPDRLFYSWRVDGGAWSSFGMASSVLLPELSPGRHSAQVRAMDRNWNVELVPVSLDFLVVVPWYRDPRLVVVSITGAVAALFFAALAVNRHLKLRKSHARVEKMVADRTRELELATQELVHSQKMTALGTLAAGIAHDFNSILSIIRGSAQIIEHNLDDREKILTRVDRIKTVVDQGGAIVRAMLGFGRVSEKSLTECDAAQLVDETLRLLGDRFLRELDVKSEISASLPAVMGIRDLTQQVLLNLILNAADAVAGGGEIRIRAGLVKNMPAHLVLVPTPSAQHVFVAVADTGCGIPREILGRVFEPFFTTKPFSSKHGTGLGLYMVYEFAKQMGYGLMVESEPGKGSVFTLYMPVAGPPPGDANAGN